MNSDNSVVIYADAKINLFLEVGEKRPDGYHDIDSVMQAISLCDRVEICESASLSLEIGKGLPEDSSNVAYKAAELFFGVTGIKGGAAVKIEKNIPVSAGLAGGSADAAAVLKGLNELYSAGLDEEQLCAIGKKIGADVPFCISGKTKKTSGVGDVLVPCPSLPECFIVVAKGGKGVSTPEAYSQIDALRAKRPREFRSSETTVKALERGKLEEISKQLYNAFEEAILPKHRDALLIKCKLLEYGAEGALMSGSGPSVFGLFKSEKKAAEASEALKTLDYESFVCAPK